MLGAKQLKHSDERAGATPRAMLRSIAMLQVATIACLTAAICAAPARAQRVTGRVVDDASESPVALASITLIAYNDSVVARTVSDTLGRFSLQGRPGLYTIRAERIGYGPGSSAPLALRELEDVTVTIRLSVAGVPMEPLEVNVRGGLERGRYGFERRRGLGKGVFLTRDSIDLREPRVATDAFRGVDGIAIDWNPGGKAEIYTYSGAKCLLIYADHIATPMQSGQYTGLSSRLPRTRRRTAGNGIFNTPVVREAAGGAGIDIAIDPDLIAAIEVYPTWAEVPQELKTADRMLDMWTGSEPCGVAIIWTLLAY